MTGCRAKTLQFHDNGWQGRLRTAGSPLGWHNEPVSVSLLVLEDDDGIRASLTMAMEDEGYEVTAQASAEQALVTLATREFDLMLVDLMLGGMDGFSFIREVRRSSDTPIIVISARDDTHDIVAALEAGADDYVTKPFQIKEVGARVRALRRRPPTRDNVLRVTPEEQVLDSEDGVLVLDRGAGSVRRDGETVPLTVTEFRLLCALADRPKQVFSRRSLLESVWERGYFGDERIVDVHVRRLRMKIEADPGEPRLLVTVRGLGYRLDTR